LRLAKGFFQTVGLSPRASEYEIRNALSRCYYAFFHISHAVLGRYRGHELVSAEVGKSDALLGEFVATLQALRIEADYIPDVVQMKYSGELGAYRLRANQVLAEARMQFERALKLAKRRRGPKKT
jgi:uncharacterized protein (UPF0332 family)